MDTGGTHIYQVFRFQENGTSFAIALHQLHHLEIVTKEEIQFSENIQRWVHRDAPLIPIFSGEKQQLHPDHHPITSNKAFVLYINLSNGGNFGIFLNPDHNDPGCIETLCFSRLHDAIVTGAGLMTAARYATSDQQDPPVYLIDSDLFFQKQAA